MNCRSSSSIRRRLGVLSPDMFFALILWMVKKLLYKIKLKLSCTHHQIAATMGHYEPNLRNQPLFTNQCQLQLFNDFLIQCVFLPNPCSPSSINQRLLIQSQRYQPANHSVYLPSSPRIISN